MAPIPSSQDDWQLPRHSRVVIAGAIFLVLLAVTSVSSLTEALRVCEVAGGGPRVCRPLSMADPPVILGILLALGFLLPDVKSFRIGPDGAEAEIGRDTVSEDENLSERLGSLERKIHLYGPSDHDRGEGDRR